MKNFIKKTKYFKIQEIISLITGTVLSKLHFSIAQDVFKLYSVISGALTFNSTIARKENELMVELKSFKYALRIKSSDLHVFDQIVLGGGIKRIIEILKEIDLKSFKIMDCGANIGLTAIELKREFPNASIACIEPEESNFRQLEKNILNNNLEGVSLLKMGIWHTRDSLSPMREFRDKKDWSFALAKSTSVKENDIPVDNPLNIANSLGWEKIDYLKIDIEGSEFSLLRNYKDWKAIFDTIKLISIEVHEEVGSTEEIIDVLKSNNFRVETFQELVIGIKNE